jgi:hypothetical protein
MGQVLVTSFTSRAAGIRFPPTSVRERLFRAKSALASN